MEEANALASRAGILAKRMLALGTADHLRRKYSDTYTVHLITRTAPHTTEAQMDNLREWVLSNFEGAILERRSLFGQLKFSIPTPSGPALDLGHGKRRLDRSSGRMSTDDDITEARDSSAASAPRPGPSGMEGATGRARDIFALFEYNKDALNLAYYSVSPSALEEVFLEVVGRHNVSEEGQETRVSWASQLRRRLQSWFVLKA